jgi:methyl-accepting chemotaxis protein
VFNFHSVQTRIAMLSGACLVLTAGVIGTTSSFMLRSSATEAVRSHAGGAASEQAGEIRSTLSRTLSTAESLANTLAGVNDPAIRLSMPRESAMAILGSILTKDPSYVGVFTAWEPDAFDAMDIAYGGVPGHDETGRFLPYSARGPDGQVAVRPMTGVDDETLSSDGLRVGEGYLRVKESRRPAVLPPRPRAGSGESVVTVIAPVVVGETFYGVVGIDLSVGFLDRVVADAASLGAGSEIAVFTGSGVVARWTDRPDAAGLPVDRAEPAMAEGLSTAAESGLSQGLTSGFMDSFVRVDVPGVDEPWLVAARIPESSAMAGVSAALRTQILVSVGLVAAGLTAVFFAARSVARPIRTAADVLRDIAEGDGDLTRRLTVSGKDELGALASGFNAFADRINALLREVRGVSEGVSEVSERMVESSAETLGDMERQRQQAFQVSAAVEEMAASADEVAGKATRTRDQANQAGDLARRGSGAVGETVESINSIRSGVGVAMEAVNELGRSSDQIGEIIAMINDIADQTNLLALNAAIEAARAGEHGRGFAVVADEVRKLAERTQSATGQVGSVIKSIQAKTGEVVCLMNDSTSRVETGVETARSAGGTLDEIVSSSVEVAEMIGGITATFAEQAAASRSISEAMDEINLLTEKTTDLSKVSAERSSELSASVDRLRSLIGAFRLD